MLRGSDGLTAPRRPSAGGARIEATPTAVGLLQDRVARAQVLDAIRGRGQAIFYDRAAELREHIAAKPVDVTLVECRDAAGLSALALIEELRRDYPRLPIIAFVVPGRTPTADILAIGRLGVHELVMRGFDDVGIALAAALESATHRCAGSRVLAALQPYLPRDVLPLVRYALERAAYEPSVVQAAEYLGVHPKTLTYRLRQAALPPPSTLIGWCRIFLAAAMLEEPGRSVAQIALSLNFASSAALRGMLRRYTGMRPSEIRMSGGLDVLMMCFLETVSAAKHKDRGAE